MRIINPFKLVAVVMLTLVAAATVWGIIALWPDAERVTRAADRAPLVAEGTTFETGELLAVTEGCAEAPGSTADDCLTFSIGIRSGDDAGQLVDITARGAVARAGLQVGDRIELMASPHVPAAETHYRLANQYSVSGVFRGLPLAILALVCIAVVIAVGRIRGLLAIVALGISASVILAFLLPALVAGSPGLPVGVVASSAIMFVILYLVHGFNMRTTSALVGTLCGIAIMAGISLIATQATRLSGIGDEASGTLAGVAEHIDFRGLLSCSVIIAGLGILNDVTITQASSVWELRAAAPRDAAARAVRERDADRPRPHRFDRVHGVFRVRRGGTRRADPAAPHRPAAALAPHARGHRDRGGAHPVRQHRPCARRTHHHLGGGLLCTRSLGRCRRRGTARRDADRLLAHRRVNSSGVVAERV